MIQPTAATELPFAPAPRLPVENTDTPDRAAFLRSMITRLGGEPGPLGQDTTELADRLARTGAHRMVADGFLVPLLSEARESTAPEGMFAPGIGEKRFGSMFDQAFADRMLESGRFPVAEVLEDRLRASFQRVAGIQGQLTEVTS
ncbi:MAG: hypothetical protein MK085_01785 [Phycisphaerales bacterium]|nr:hypothetical protein [Phycisphaerales bacterium]